MQAKETTTERLLAAYEEFGYKLVKVDPNEKHPNYREWQLKTISGEELRKWLTGGGNVGIQTGAVSDWICAADLDCAEAVQLAPEFLPDTLKSGKQGIPSHWVFRSPGAGYVQFRDVDGKMLIELKASADGAGHQFVVEPSAHPEKGPYRWIPTFNPALIAEVPQKQLAEKVRHLAVAVLIVRNFPADGGHDYANALCGFLLRNGMTVEVLGHILEVCWPKEKARRHNVTGALRDTWDKLQKDAPVKGGRTLEELAPGLPKALAKTLGWERPDKRDGRRSYPCTDTGNAERFTDRHGGGLRYCYPYKHWFVYDGKRWRKDDTGHVVRLAKETARSIFEEAARAENDQQAKELGKWAIQSQSEKRIQAMIELAKPEVPVLPDELDTNPFLLNVQNGTIDLRTGELLPHNREDLLTKITEVEYDVDATAPTWQAFLRRVQPSESLRSFVQRAVGYSATGDTREQCMFINHGVGANGKSTFQEAISEALGAYAMRTPTETLLAKRAGGIPNDIARLKGARCVTASETEEGRRLAESLVKDLTGQDTITARYMRAEWFDFRPTHKLWLSTNHKPEIRGTDNAIWRRIRLIPWTVTIPPGEQDRTLPSQLRAELPGILVWVVQGCLAWLHEGGLQAPNEVRRATRDYRAEMDILAAFLGDCCETGDDYWGYAKDLYTSYKRWCDETGERPESQRKFGGRLGERGFRRDKGGSRGAHIWRGVRLTEVEKARVEGMLTLQKAAVSRGSDPTDPKSDINDPEYTSRGVTTKKGQKGQ